MKTGPALNRFFLLLALVAIGWIVSRLPAALLAQYEAIKPYGATWVYAYFATVAVGSLLMLGAGGTIVWKLWRATREKYARRERGDKSPGELSLAERKQEIDENLTAAGELRDDAQLSPELREQLRPLAAKLEEKRTSERLEIAAFGTISSGKSSLLNALAGSDVFTTDLRGGTTARRQEIAWSGADRVTLVDTPGLGEIDGAEHIAIAAEAARDSDLVLLTVDGPLRNSEFELLKRLGEMEKRIIVCLNKADWYSPHERDELLGQIASQTEKYVARHDLVAVRSRAVERSRTYVLPDGTEEERLVSEPAEIGPLAERMTHALSRERDSLLLANLLLQSRGLVETARAKLQESIDRRAWDVVERYTWGAGGAAALSPTPVLDLLAGCAITAKMTVDLAGVYKQSLDFDTANVLLGQLGKNLISILGASAAAPAVAAVVASLLKTVPGAGTIAGGVLQGVVQALVTRWIGAVFIEYFRREMKPPEGGLAGIARREWEKLTSRAELLRFVQEAREKLGGGRR